jgi:hypothetical protein
VIIIVNNFFSTYTKSSAKQKMMMNVKGRLFWGSEWDTKGR